MSRRGFSLLEVAIVLVVTAILAAMSLSAYGHLKGNASFSSFTKELVSNLDQARSRAMLDQRPVIVVLLDSSGRTVPVRYIVFEDVDGNFDPATFDPTQPIAAPDVLLADESAPNDLRPGPSNGYGVALPAPFASVPANQAATFGSTASFSAPWDRRAMLRFEADGTLTLGTGAPSGSLTLEAASAPGRLATIALVGPAGVVREFDR